MTYRLIYQILLVLLLFLVFPYLSIPLFTQNLILNGNFEQGNFDCQEANFNIFKILDNWQNVNLLPTYYRKNCSSSNPLNNSISPYSGNGHLGILGNVWVTGIVDGSIVKGQLLQPLETDKLYYLEFYGKSTGLRQDNDFTSKLCLFNPPHDISIFLGTTADSFEVEKIFDDSTLLLTSVSTTNTFERVDFIEPIIIKPNAESWTKYQTCIRARGGEEQIAIAATIRNYPSNSPCEVINLAEFDRFDDQRLHQIFSFEIDNMQMVELPKVLEGRDTICNNRENIINLYDYLPQEFCVLQQAIFRWPDGKVGSIQNINDAGIFNISIELPCGVLPFDLTLIDEDCPSELYVPTVFSPNNDGINDEFRPLFSDFYEIVFFEMEVYNRWGGRVFYSNHYQDGWNGKFKQKTQSNDEYIWTVAYRLAGSDELKKLSGTVSLLK